MTGSLLNRFSIIVIWIPFKKDSVHMTSIFFSYLQKFVLSRRLKVSNRSFIKVAHIVKFVAVHHKSVGFVPHHIFIGPNLGSVRRIKITIWFLCRRNHIYDTIELRLEFRVILQLSQVGSTLHYFIKVRINKPMGSVVLHFLPS